MKLTIHIDGGSRGNPGPAGAGVLIQDASDRPVRELGFFLGRMTNNMAEYSALLHALDEAAEIGAGTLAIRCDSELLVRQIKREYRVRNAGLQPLHAQAVKSLGRFDAWEIRHIPRELNSRADELANMAMDLAEDVVITNTDAKQVAASGSTGGATSVGRRFIACCERAPDPAVCPAPCATDSELVFDRVMPAGVCLDAAAALLRAVDASEKTGAPVEADCPRTGCNARFRIQVSQDK